MLFWQNVSICFQLQQKVIFFRIGDSRGHVLGYNLPKDVQYGPWNKRVLASGFTADYSPGKAIAYWPDKNKRGYYSNT